MRTLCISHCLPFPASTGGHQRTALLMRALEEYGPTDLIQVARYGPLPGRTCLMPLRGTFQFHRIGLSGKAAGTIGRGNWCAGFDRGWWIASPTAFGKPGDPLPARSQPPQAAVRRAMAANTYDVIVGRHLYPSAMAGVLEESPGIPILIDLDDVDHLVAREMTHDSIPWYKRAVFARQRPQIESRPRARRRCVGRRICGSRAERTGKRCRKGAGPGCRIFPLASLGMGLNPATRRTRASRF